MSIAARPAPQRLVDRAIQALIDATPALLFGLRMATAVSLALYLAFALELENPGWAGTSAAIVCQPVLGASLRKGMFRLVGTVIGAVATVVLTAWFPQDRLGFLLGMAAWCAACSFISTILKNFAAYAAMLAGYTMVIIASSSIAAPNQVFFLAVYRGSEIGIGIVCGMLVVSLTDLGASMRLLRRAILSIMAAITSGFVERLREADQPGGAQQQGRRALIKRVIALDPLADQVVGERPGLHRHRATLSGGIGGLFLALSAWRSASEHLSVLPPQGARERAALVSDLLPASLLSLETTARAEAFDAAACRDEWIVAARDLRAWPTTDASSRLLGDRAASVLDGLSRAANLLVLMTRTRHALPVSVPPTFWVPDILPPLVNASRVFLAIAMASVFVIVSAWPSGLTFVTFLSVTVILLSPRDELAMKAGLSFSFGTLLACAIAAIVNFAVLPNREGYLSFMLIMFAVLVPMAALSTRPHLAALLVPASANYLPLLAPTNRITFNTVSFYNGSMAIVGGCLIGVVIFWVLPAVPTKTRARRLVGLTLADIRKLARRPGWLSPNRLRSRALARLVALPSDAELVQGADILAGLTVGLQILFLRETLGRQGEASTLMEAANQALAAGDVALALDRFDRFRAFVGDLADKNSEIVRVRAAVQEITETVRMHRDFFEAVIR